MTSSATFADELARFGPSAAAEVFSLDECRSYCRHLARSHYENFTVASRLLPAALRQHFYHVYAYCRWADDLADETGDSQRSLELLDWWEAELSDCYAGRPRHPVFRALQETIDTFSIPAEPFRKLLVAFRQDQQVNRYDDFDQLSQYCSNSANPVGHLVLYLARSYNETSVPLSNMICTGLQLANFWQDVAGDWQRGRIYLPQSTCRQFGYDESQFARREFNAAFREALRFEVERAEEILKLGEPLVYFMPPELKADIWLFLQGGLKILAHIRRLDYNVWRRRPKIARHEQFALLAGFVWRRWLHGRSSA
ncbi:MAG TPA: squalene synthase HpnC [Pirellulales bacterium]